MLIYHSTIRLTDFYRGKAEGRREESVEGDGKPLCSIYLLPSAFFNTICPFSYF